MKTVQTTFDGNCVQTMENLDNIFTLLLVSYILQRNINLK
jgi:hypothetical protein